MQRSSEEQILFNENYYKRQFELLEYMYKDAEKQGLAPTEANYTVKIMAEGSKLKNEDEILRFLYIMEGQKLVSPYPHGDFTSDFWCLTAYGEDIARKLVMGSIDLEELW